MENECIEYECVYGYDAAMMTMDGVAGVRELEECVVVLNMFLRWVEFIGYHINNRCA